MVTDIVYSRKHYYFVDTKQVEKSTRLFSTLQKAKDSIEDYLQDFRNEDGFTVDYETTTERSYDITYSYKTIYGRLIRERFIVTWEPVY